MRTLSMTELHVGESVLVPLSFSKSPFTTIRALYLGASHGCALLVPTQRVDVTRLLLAADLLEVELLCSRRRRLLANSGRPDGICDLVSPADFLFLNRSMQGSLQGCRPDVGAGIQAVSLVVHGGRGLAASITDVPAGWHILLLRLSHGHRSG